MLDCAFEAGDEWRGWGRKKKEKTREMSGWRGGRQAQMMETLASMEDQTAAYAFVPFLVSCHDWFMQGEIGILTGHIAAPDHDT